MGYNEREVQAAVIRGLATLGLPDPEHNVVVQAQYVPVTYTPEQERRHGQTIWQPQAKGRRILVTRVRFAALRSHRWLVNGGLTPVAEVAYTHPDKVQRRELRAWAEDVVPLDAMAVVQVEVDNHVRTCRLTQCDAAWPREWPRLAAAREPEPMRA